MTPEIAAEASVWIARLHGPDRSVEMERECLSWQARSAAHRLAFERCTDVWEAVPGVRLADAYASAASRAPAGSVGANADLVGTRRWLLSAMGLVLILGVSGGAFFMLGSGETFGTRVGEQQNVLLDDGSRMVLNTNTQVHVKMGTQERSIRVDKGEALFEVAKDSRRPFVVRAAGSEVVAVGTVFSVRLGAGAAQPEDAVAVTLVEGRVTVRPAGGLLSAGAAPAQPISMQAGDQVRLVKAQDRPYDVTTAHLDKPDVERLVAWKRGEVVFDDVSLSEAVGEMNRYSKTRLVLRDDAILSTLRVSGLYRTGDSSGFAQAVAALHGLKVREHEGRLELGRAQ
ncbi:MAG: FecR domain-containing protein [Paucibacter sp.]|nr:FecR domain-containing protein [Roseateles sp.]